jgi:uncharacterized protein Yka (UPF0111/DUF47 family)
VVANERAKYVLSLLQLAASHADHPESPVVSLRADREACGIVEPCLDRVVAEAESDGKGNYAIPEAERLRLILTAALQGMMAPLALVARASEQEAALHQEYARRFDRQQGALASLGDELTSADTIAALTSGRPRSGDGVHLLVMDLHRELNRLIAGIAEETIEGARAFGTVAEDRPLIAAFMTGLKRTAPVKFDHPGLATTAIRSGERLLIQNDIGETEAHVIVAAVTGRTVALTHSDIHVQRLRFLQRMLAASGVAWEEMGARRAGGLGKEDIFYTTQGRFVAADDAALRDFLEYLGSRLVFLIDWNRARKRLALLVPGALAVEILAWAAEHEFGHRGFLQLGGERLVYDALERAVHTPLRYGEPLHQMIGADAAGNFLRFVLQATSTGLREGRSAMLISDRIRVELFNHLRSAEQRLLAEAARHADLIKELADGLEAALRENPLAAGEARRRHAERAKLLESRADDIVKATRSTVRRIADAAIFGRTLEIADDAADALEDAAFLAGLLERAVQPEALPPAMLDLASLVAAGSGAYCRFLEIAPDMHRGAARQSIDRFLAAIEELVTIEHQTDAKEREVTTALVGAPSDARPLFLLAGLARHLEGSMDALLHAALMLRDHMLRDIMFA